MNGGRQVSPIALLQEDVYIGKKRLMLHLFHDCSFNYKIDCFCLIGNIDKICYHCQALKWKDQAPGMCCANGKVKIQVTAKPSEPLKDLMLGNSVSSHIFLFNICKYNTYFQMTSFRASREIYLLAVCRLLKYTDRFTICKDRFCKPKTKAEAFANFLYGQFL